MATKYPPYIRKRGYLKALPTRAFLNAPAWGWLMLTKALNEFNRMARNYKLGVSIVTPPAEPESLPNFGADVFIDAHVGSGTYVDIDGTTKKVALPAEKNTYQGFTQPVEGGGTKLYPGWFRYRSYIFMYAFPNIDGETVGPGVRTAVLLHELIHACGLEGTDPNHGLNGHMPGSPHDLFCTGGVFQTVTGDMTHEKDYISWGDARSPTKDGTFSLSARTIQLIHDNWLP